MPGDRARKAGKKAREQASGTARNTRELVGSFTFDQVLPNAIAGTISELFALIPRALGRESPKSQVYASTTLILLAIIATPFTLGWSLVLAGPPAITLIIGLWRLIPAVNERFAKLRGGKLRNRDVPLWRRD
jgi:hypothetical protein